MATINNAGDVSKTAQRYIQEIKKVILGMDDTLRLVMLSFLTDGHLLLEARRGLAKSLLARTLAKAIKGGASGVLGGTEDLMPADLIGSFTLNLQTREMEEQFGALLPTHNIFVLDEINRLSGKSCNAMLMPLQERIISIQRR